MRRIEHVMGLPVSIDVPAAKEGEVFDKAFILLHQIDERFSPYKKTSELSAYWAGDVSERDLSGEMRGIMQACREFEQRTNGYFTAYFGGRFDPTGLVKGWAAGEVGKLLEDQGYTTYMINAGGDIVTRSSGRRKWRIGLQHPTKPHALMGTLRAKNLAIATSGNYARGSHIVNPLTGEKADELLSATVIGPGIATADALATAVFAMGFDGIEFMQSVSEYRAIIVDTDLRMYDSRDRHSRILTAT